MYFLNVTHLKQFYASDLGKVASKLLRRKFQRIWPRSAKDVTLAIGYPNELWADASQEQNLLIAMPAEQGAVVFPHDKNKVFIGAENQLPLSDNTINRVILLHTLEHNMDISGLMQEIWRVLASNGRVLCIVPNRLGLWALSSKSPFGYGRPFSIHQIKSVIEESQLTYLRTHHALYFPPSHNRMLLRLVEVVDFFVQFFLPMCGGVHIVEAEKQLYASIPEPIKAQKRQAIKPVAVATMQPSAK